MYLCVVVTKGSQFDQFDWPRKLRSQVSIHNIDISLPSVISVLLQGSLNVVCQRRVHKQQSQRRKENVARELEDVNRERSM